MDFMSLLKELLIALQEKQRTQEELIQTNTATIPSPSANPTPDIILATGIPAIDEVIKQKVSTVTFSKSMFYREGVFQFLEEHQVNSLIVSELLEGHMNTKEFIIDLRIKYPNLHIVYLLNEYNEQEVAFLKEWHIHDILTSPFTIHKLKDVIYRK